ncbi:hypothetical protein PACTADRAFT_14039 [Pachysolen tannophilus NRRL Y-2460]|uniref:Uncharacterized protein n=1 Tax=Pachysolen tannophilus NRRL Y-2460 TaxID=669874 RepID=A0A1E4U0E6_PACTA|nr:hypothetical protein PACTADRAFT_14039 [Pachysolen tannophilus NRRL Y-2460]
MIRSNSTVHRRNSSAASIPSVNRYLKRKRYSKYVRVVLFCVFFLWIFLTATYQQQERISLENQLRNRVRNAEDGQVRIQAQNQEYLQTDGVLTRIFSSFFTVNFNNKNPNLIKEVDLKNSNFLKVIIKDLLQANKPNAFIINNFETTNKFIDNDKNQQMLRFKRQTDITDIVTKDLLMQNNVLTDLSNLDLNSLAGMHGKLLLNLLQREKSFRKIYENSYVGNTNGVVILNELDNKSSLENVFKTMLTIRSLEKVNSQIPIKVVFQSRTNDILQDHYIKDFCQTYLLESTLDASCVLVPNWDNFINNFEVNASEKLGFNENFLKKAILIFGISFEKMMVLKSGNLVLNNIDHLFSENEYNDVENLIFWSEKYSKRLTNPLFYDITSFNVNGVKEDKLNKFGKDKYYVNEEIFKTSFGDNIPFHGTESTLIDSTTDSSQFFMNKKYHFRTLLLSLYYDYYNQIYYPLITGVHIPSSSSSSLEGVNRNDGASNSGTTSEDGKIIQEEFENHSLTETLFAASFVFDEKYKLVNRDPDIIRYHSLADNHVAGDAFSFNIQHDPVNDTRTLSFYKEKATSELSQRPNSVSYNYKKTFIDYFKKNVQYPLFLTAFNYNNFFKIIKKEILIQKNGIIKLNNNEKEKRSFGSNEQQALSAFTNTNLELIKNSKIDIHDLLFTAIYDFADCGPSSKIENTIYQKNNLKKYSKSFKKLFIHDIDSLKIEDKSFCKFINQQLQR